MIQISIDKVTPNGVFGMLISPVSGKTFVVPGWVEVPKGTTQSDIEIVGKRKVFEPTFKKYKVSGSKGNEYDVIIESTGKHSCSCVGFGFHRTCKHIKEILNKNTKK